MSNFIETFKEKIKYIKDLKKGGFVSDEVKEERMSICRSCVNFRQHVITSGCAICGCSLESKTRLAYAVCPINKWLKVERTE